MAKKKNLQRKHKFKHVEGQPVPREQGLATETDNSGQVYQPPRNLQAVSKPATASRDFSYVGVDLRRIGIMAISLVALELVLYYLLIHTSLGSSIYSLVKV